MSAADGIVGRGVLLDVPAVRATTHLEATDSVTVADLEAAEEAQGVSVGPGDLLIISTGRDARRESVGGRLDPFGGGLPGLHPRTLPWLHERQIALLGSDGISDHMPFTSIPEWPFPIHQIGITGIGLHLIDNMRGSPVNPIAVL
jgi:kynurenine formamidase